MFCTFVQICLESFSIFIDIAVIMIQNKHQTEKQKQKNTNQQQTIPHHILLLFKEKRFVIRKCRDQFCADQFNSYVSFSESSRWWLRRNLSKICIQILFSKFSSKSNHSHSNEKGTYIFLTYLCLTFQELILNLFKEML